MKSNHLLIPATIICLSLIIAITLMSIKKEQKPNHTSVKLDILSTQAIVPNRVNCFIQVLNNRNAYIKNQQDFLVKTQDRNFRFQLAQQTNIDTNLILLHYEIIQLKNLGLNETDAQMLHFAHRNYQCPFTGITINPTILASTNPESILMDIQGFCAGNEDPFTQSYSINLATIKFWIKLTLNQKQVCNYSSLFK